MITDPATDALLTFLVGVLVGTILCVVVALGGRRG